jgi:D-alanine-D-alanine ligase
MNALNHQALNDRIQPLLTNPAALGRVAVLMGGRSAERDISLMSGQGVLQALQSLGVDAQAFDPAQQSLSELETRGFQRAFVALHGRFGEDGAIQGVLEWLGIPYTGSGIMASGIAMDKVMTKQVWQVYGLPTAPHVVLGAHEVQGAGLDAAMQRVLDRLGLPVIVKPPHEGSSIGVSKVTQAGQLAPALQLAARYDAHILCEAFIDGAEITCPVLGEGEQALALPVVSIRAPEGSYDYQHKYFTDDVVYHCPSGLPTEQEARIQALVVRAYQALGCRGWGRADLIIRASDQQAYLLEMNPSPGMTSHSLAPMSARAAGLSYEHLCLWLLSQARLDAGKQA